jgi:hypothetical protein
MKGRGRFCVWLLFSLFAAGAGYLWWQGDPTLPEEKDPELSPIEVRNPYPASEKLAVHLKKGQVFPLMKTVTETVSQFTTDGPVESKMVLKVLLVIRVQEVLKDRTKLRVDYQRVRFNQNSPGKQTAYDSDAPPQAIPLDAQLYHGLAKNGFEFWIGKDHKVIEPVDGFTEFLKRCVVHVSPKQREAVMRQFVQTTGDDAIANFIDDSIGLLPAQDKSVKTGDKWTRKRQVQRPVPLYLTSHCTLKKLDAKYAEITIDGSVIPSVAYGQTTNAGQGMQLSVTGGHLTGECRIRRETGLPEESKIRRVFEMLVRLPNGREVKQRKDTTTTIAVYSPQGSPKSIATPNSRASTIKQASGTTTNGNRRN